MKRLLLLNPPGELTYIRDQYSSVSSKGEYCWAPIDLLVQSGVFYGNYEIKVIDAMAESIGFDVCLERVVSYNPDGIIFLTSLSSWKRKTSGCERRPLENCGTPSISGER